MRASGGGGVSGGEFSREALRELLGDEAFEQAQAAGRNAPDPSPELVERVRRIFAAAELSSRPIEQESARHLPRAA